MATQQPGINCSNRPVTARSKKGFRHSDPGSALVFFALLMLTLVSAASQAERMLLLPERVFDGREMHDDWVVLVEGERIAYRGPRAAMPGGEIDRELTLQGQTLLPGLIEGHSHILLHPYNETPWNDQVLRESEAERVARGVTHARASLMAGVTTLRDLGSEGADYADVGLRDAINKGVIPGPRLLVAGRALVATGSYGPKGFHDRVEVPLGAQTADGDDDLIRTVREQIGRGIDVVKVYADYRWGPDGTAQPTYTQRELQTIVQVAHSSGRPVAAHAATAEAMRRATLAGVDTIEHGSSASAEVLQLMAERGVALCPTLAAGEAISAYAGWKKGIDSPPPRVLAQQQSFQLAREAGVKICFGGDVGVYPHGENVIELELMVEYGMSPLEALRAATAGNAEIFGLDAKIGRVETGLIADLIAVRGNPLADIRALRQVSLIMQGGRVVGPTLASPEHPALQPVAGLAARGSLTDAEFAQLKARAKGVTIIRDDYGVPHIYGKTDADAVFGLLYAQAEDDFPRIERNYLWAIGRLAEAEGESALYSDLRARLYMSTEEAKAAYANAPAWLQQLCDAFAQGLNFYLASHPEVRPQVLQRFEPWMPMFFFEGSIGGDIEQIPLDGIEAFYSGQDRPTPLPSVASRADREPRGSNGFAIAGERTASGSAMLLINPHTSFYFRGEVHVVSEEGLNAYGAVTWGQFFVYQGFNERTGWMHTSTYADFMDEFVEDVSDVNGQLMYRYGQELRPLEVSEVVLRYRDDDGIKERRFPRYRSHHGPITHSVDGRWVATRINWRPSDALAQSYLRSKQQDYAGFQEMMRMRTNSSNNTVYADADGNIAYYHGNFMPRRDPQFDYAKPVDGSNPATDWQGLHPLEETLQLLNPQSGWIQNCNSTPFTAAGTFSPRREDYPRYMAPDPENFRGIHAQALLPAVQGLTLDGLINLAYDPYLPAFEKLIPALVNAYDQMSDHDDAALAAAVAALRDWNLRVSADSIAMTLAHFYAQHALDVGELPTGLSRMQKIDRLAGRSASEQLQWLRETQASLTEDYGRWDLPWGEVNRFQRLTGDIRQPHSDSAPSLPVAMASGRWGALASYGARRFPGTKKLYGVAGNSFVAVVEFGERVRARSLLAGGQSGDPDSPHFDDQAQRYVDGEFKDVAFYREDVEARAARRYHPGE